MIDTHAHIYLEEFDADRDAVVERAMEAGIEKIVLPNIDSASIAAMLFLEQAYPDIFHAAIGLHPTYVKENFQEELDIIAAALKRRDYIAIGEIGIDLYWDKTFLQEQIKVFQQQIEWALSYNKPIIIHLRDSFQEVMDSLAPYKNSGLRGVFHSFGGSLEQAQAIIDFGGFLMGINGIVTFKNSGLADVVRQIDLKHILLETDAPYLTPVPYRGKRNESAYMVYTANKLAEIYNTTLENIVSITTKNAKGLFDF